MFLCACVRVHLCVSGKLKQWNCHIMEMWENRDASKKILSVSPHLRKIQPVTKPPFHKQSTSVMIYSLQSVTVINKISLCVSSLFLHLHCSLCTSVLSSGHKHIIQNTKYIFCMHVCVCMIMMMGLRRGRGWHRAGARNGWGETNVKRNKFQSYQNQINVMFSWDWLEYLL